MLYVVSLIFCDVMFRGAMLGSVKKSTFKYQSKQTSPQVTFNTSLRKTTTVSIFKNMFR